MFLHVKLNGVFASEGTLSLVVVVPVSTLIISSALVPGETVVEHHQAGAQHAHTVQHGGGGSL